MSKDLFTALAVSRRALAVARLERARKDWRISATETVSAPVAEPSAPSPDGAADTAASEAPPPALPAAASTGPLTLCIPSEDVLFYPLTLPAADESELAGMVSLKLEDLAVLPLPTDEMTVSWERIGSQDEENIRLLVAAVPTATLDALAARLSLSHERVQRIDVAVFAFLRALLDRRPDLSSGNHLVLFGEPGSLTLCHLSQGAPLLVRPLGSDALPSARLARLLRLSLLQSEEGADSPSAPDSLVFVSPGPAPDLQFAVGDKVLPVDHVPDLPWNEAVPAGAARRSQEGAPLNLVPSVWTDDIANRRFRSTLLRIVVGGAALWILCAFALFGGPRFLDNSAESLQTTIDALQPAVDSVSAVRHRVRLIRTYMDRTYSPLEVFLEVCKILPDGITFSNFRYARPDARVVVNASAESTDLVYDFKRAVDASPLFAESRLTSGPTQNQRTRESDFELTIRLAVPTEEGAAP